MSTKPLNWHSRTITAGPQLAARAFYPPIGLRTPQQLAMPQVAIATPLLDVNTCNQHVATLLELVKTGCKNAGMFAGGFGVTGVSDNISQGIDGGDTSLPSRNIIADGCEMVVRGHCQDALLGFHNCDKNGPGVALALARMNVPGFIISGGSIRAGCHRGKPAHIQTVYDGAAKFRQGAIEEGEMEQIIATSCPGPGGCGIAASFNTWALAMEAGGLMLPFSSSNIAESTEKQVECLQAGAAMRHLLETGIRPRDILTKAAFANMIKMVAACRGSTNAVLHILALAHEAKVEFTLEDMQSILRETPVYANFAPAGTKTMEDLFHMGGTPLIIKLLIEEGVLDGSCITCTGKTLAENVADVPLMTEGNDLIAPKGKPWKPYADLQVCFGNLAKYGIVFKVSSLDNPEFTGTAICFDTIEQLTAAAAEDRIQEGHVVILRGWGPLTGMRELLVATAALSTPKLKGKVAFLSDGRVSGVSHGAMGIHCSPEAYAGGPIGFVNDGDTITFNLLEGTINLDVTPEELDARRSAAGNKWSLRKVPVYLRQWGSYVTQAHMGGVSEHATRFEPDTAIVVED